MRVERLNVGDVGAGGGGHVWALWPSPVDHDQCLRDAGFDAFADTDDAWDADLGGIVARTVRALQAVGAVVGGASPPGAREAERIAEALLVGTRWDNEPPVIVRFGEPPAAEVRTGDGHPILWIWLAAGDLSEHLQAIAGTLEIARRDLQWDGLFPVERPRPVRKKRWWQAR